jgi:ATP-dependent Clp protease ATP-binding subunit ClpC
MPVSKLNVDEKKYLKTLETILKGKIIGQDESIIEVCNAIKRNKVGLSNNNHPSLTALLIGPTGVGKTLLAKVLAKDILGDEKYLVRFDMSEYTDETSVNKLIGSSAGYVGYNDGGVLTEAIKRNKYCVLLLDEIEKAHPKVFNLFLQILDEGFLTDNMGQKVDFKNTYILMTSNVGTKKAYNHNSIGFNNVEISTKQNIIEKEMKNTFPPEFLNRFDNILFFKTLTDENLKKIIVLELKYLQEKLEKLFYTLKYNDDLVDCILDKLNNDKNYGARPIKRIIKNEIENQIADLIINNEYEEQHVFNLFVENKNIIIK